MLRDLFSLFPAYAGVILTKTTGEKTEITFPRICGGDPNEAHFLNIPKLFSPHMRG